MAIVAAIAKSLEDPSTINILIRTIERYAICGILSLLYTPSAETCKQNQRHAWTIDPASIAFKNYIVFYPGPSGIYKIRTLDKKLVWAYSAWLHHGPTKKRNASHLSISHQHVSPRYSVMGEFEVTVVYIFISKFSIYVSKLNTWNSNRKIYAYFMFKSKQPKVLWSH